MKFIKLLLVVVLLLVFLTNLQAQMPMVPMQEMHEEMHGSGAYPLTGEKIGPMMKTVDIDFLLSLPMIEKLELTEDQLKSLKTLKKDSTKDKIKKRAEIETAEVDLKELLDADELDLPKIQTKLKEIANLRAELQYLDIEAYEKGKTLLSAGQKTKLKESPMKKMEGPKPGEKPKPKRRT